MRDHPSAAELEWYVTDGLTLAERGWERERVSALETHLESCDECTARLAGEARVELALESLARRPARRPGIGAWIAAGLAVAALLLVITVGRTSAETDPPLPAAGPPADAGIELAIDGDVPPTN
jgi:hypothetical protein